jgi:hypothetical protein
MSMLKAIIEEVAGIAILLGKPVDPEVLTALESMDRDHVKEYRDSLAEEFGILRPNTHLLLED